MRRLFPGIHQHFARSIKLHELQQRLLFQRSCQHLVRALPCQHVYEYRRKLLQIVLARDRRGVNLLSLRAALDQLQRRLLLGRGWRLLAVPRRQRVRRRRNGPRQLH